MIRQFKITTFLAMFLAISTFMLNGCVPVIIGGAAAGSKILSQDKTVGEVVSDSTIWTKIRASFIANNLDSLVGSVNVKVSEGRVLLTGYVLSSDTMLKVIRVCWDQDGVKEVINELKISESDQKDFVGYSKDSWITTRIKSKMLITGGVKSINYNIVTIEGAVYLIGIARTQEELDTVTDIAATVSGVEKVVSYVKVQGDLESRVEKTRGSNATNSPMYEYNAEPMPVTTELLPTNESIAKSNAVLDNTANTDKSEDWQKEEVFDGSF